MINKYFNSANSLPSIPTLNAYLEQAKSFQTSGNYRQGKQLLKKAALSAAIPLAAANVAKGQCMATHTMVLNSQPSQITVQKFLPIAIYSCFTVASNNATCFYSFPSNFLSAVATVNAINPLCSFSCMCDGNSITMIIDSGDGLPVELSKFEVTSGVKKIILNWETSSELNNSGFEILRSKDGFFFQKIGWLKGNGNSVVQNTYEFIDPEVKLNTTYYYRLKQLDFDGAFEYSPVKSAIVIDKSELVVGEVYPNPVKRNFARIEVNTPRAVEARIILFDGRGQLIYQGMDNLVSGSNYLKINVSSLGASTYFAKVIVDNEMWYRKIIVQ